MKDPQRFYNEELYWAFSL